MVFKLILPANIKLSKQIKLVHKNDLLVLMIQFYYISDHVQTLLLIRSVMEKCVGKGNIRNNEWVLQLSTIILRTRLDSGKVLNRNWKKGQTFRHNYLEKYPSYSMNVPNNK